MFPAAAKAVSEAAHEELATQLKRATAYHEQADYAHSIPILKRIVQQSPRNYAANILLGEDLFSSGDIRDAIGPLEVACRVKPQDATAEVYLADATVTLGEFPRASEALQAGIARSGGSEQFLKHGPVIAWNATECWDRR
jgi:predicted Zn-dependent protease